MIQREWPFRRLLPSPDILDGSPTWSRVSGRAPDHGEQLVNDDALCKRLLSTTESREDLEWLQSHESTHAEIGNWLGELGSTEDSIDLAKILYSSGAVKVWAVEIAQRGTNQKSSKLVIELPRDPCRRAGALAEASKIVTEQGFEPIHDDGQQYVWVRLD